MAASPKHRHGSRLLAIGVVAAAALLVTACMSPPTDPVPTTQPPAEPGSTATLPIGGETVTAVVSNDLTVTLAVADPAALPPAPPGASFPLGAIDLDVQNVTPGEVARVTITLSSPVDAVRKLIGGSWDLFTFDGLTGASISADGRTITLDLQDGGRGDTDGAANGTIADPFAPVVATSLTITSNDAPVTQTDVPYSFQLESAGATGDVQWGITAGGLADGLTLSESGLISGTPTEPMLMVQVEATDDLTSVRKLLLIAQFDPNAAPPTSTSTPLPDGSRIYTGSLACDTGCALSIGTFGADGTAAVLGTTSVATYRAIIGAGFASPDGRLVAIRYATSVDWYEPIDVVDADTGDLVHRIEDSDGASQTLISFSPDGSRLLVPHEFGGVRVIDTSDWHQVRTVPFDYTTSPVWSPDSSELALAKTSSGAALIYSADDGTGAADRTIPTPDCASVTDWSITGRLALGCGNPYSPSIRTASALDGSDVRTVAASSCPDAPCTFVGVPGGPVGRFSPSGQFVALSINDYSPFPTAIGARLAYAADVDNGTVTTLAGRDLVSPASGFIFPSSWR